MELDSTIWVGTGVLAVIVLTGGLWAFRTWRKTREEDEHVGFIFGLIELVLDSPVKETKRELAEIPLAQCLLIRCSIVDRVGIARI